MMTIEAHRAAIGNFYSRARRHHRHQASGNSFSYAYRQQHGYFGDEEMLFLDNESNNMFCFLKTLFFLTTIVTISCNINLASLKLLLILSGDVELNPGPRSIDMQIALNESYAYSLLSNHSAADRIVNNARRIGLNVSYDEPTLGDGNCFYRAVVQQLRIPEIRNFVHPNLIFTDHDQLRLAVVKYIRQNSSSQLFQNYRYVESCQQGNMTWEQLLTSQERSTVYAEEMFIRATAMMLNLNILVTSETHSRSVPYNLISCSPDESHNISGERQITQMLTDGKETGVLIRLGRINENHFQSLLINDTGSAGSINVTSSSSKSSAVKDQPKATTAATSTQSKPPPPIKTPAFLAKEKVPCLSSDAVKNVPPTILHPQKDLVKDIMTSIKGFTKPKGTETNTENKIRRQQNNFIKKEHSIKEKCDVLNIPYHIPKENETTTETKNRRQRLTRICTKKEKELGLFKQSKSVKPDNLPIDTVQVPPITTQSKNISAPSNPAPAPQESELPSKDPMQIPVNTDRPLIANEAPSNPAPHESRLPSNDAMQIPANIEEPLIADEPMVPDDEPAIELVDISSIHTNPDVVLAALRFEEGETLHTVATCKTCF